MINPPEPKQSAVRRHTEEIQPERQYVLKYLTSLLGIRYQWYLVFFVVVLGLFVFSPTLPR